MYKGTIVTIGLCTLLYGSGATFTASDIQKAKNEASSLSGSFSGTYRGNSNITSRIFTPMTSKADLHTMDGSKSGQANLTCQDAPSGVFLTVSYVGSGDITVEVAVDYNLDGSFDNHFYFNGVSGIHANGIVQCDTGTFNNCKYYNWNYTLNNLSLVETTTKINAYCINNSCGNIAASEKYRILKDLSGQLSALIQNSQSDLLLSKIDISGGIAKVYAQDYSNCQNNNQAVYKAGSGIPSDATLRNQAANAQMSDPTGAYEVVTSATTNEQNKNPIQQSELNDIKSIAKNSSDVVVDSSDPNNINYTSSYKDENGNWVVSKDSTKIQYETPPASKSCMVAWDEVQTDVTSDGKVKGHSGSGSGPSVIVKTEIRECINDYTVCPVANNERIKYDCGKLNNSIADVAAGMQVIDNAVKDFSCSTN